MKAQGRDCLAHGLAFHAAVAGAVGYAASSSSAGSRIR